MTAEASISQLARHLGIARATVRKGLALGMPRDLPGASAWRQATVDPERSKRAHASPPGAAAARGAQLIAGRTRKVETEARIAELQLQQLQGKLVNADVIRREYGRRLSNLRSGLLQIGARIGPVVAAESDLVKVTQLIDDAVIEVMAEAVSQP